MLVRIYQVGGGAYSFRSSQGATQILVQVPKGSELLATRGLGIDLFVPVRGTKLRTAWSASAVISAARQGRGDRFRIRHASAEHQKA